jgi:hypothetical protein
MSRTSPDQTRLWEVTQRLFLLSRKLRTWTSDKLPPSEEFRNSLVPARNADPENRCVLTHVNKEDQPR